MKTRRSLKRKALSCRRDLAFSTMPSRRMRRGPSSRVGALRSRCCGERCAGISLVPYGLDESASEKEREGRTPPGMPGNSMLSLSQTSFSWFSWARTASLMSLRAASASSSARERLEWSGWSGGV